MVDLPKHFPRFCRDLRQTIEEYGISPNELPKQEKNLEHNALYDAMWVRDAYKYVKSHYSLKLETCPGGMLAK